MSSGSNPIHCSIANLWGNFVFVLAIERIVSKYKVK